MIVTMAGAAAAARRTPSGSYSLSLAPATFTMTGRAANLSLSVDVVLTLASTSFTTTGVAARTRADRKLVLAPASLTATGVAAATKRGRKLIASPTTFSMSGAPNSPTRVARKLVLAPAAFSITGIAADLAIATGETDEHWASVVSLLNGTGSNGSTTFTDATGRHTWTVANGTPTIQGNMIEFDGASALVTNDNLADFSFDGDFTIEGEIIGVTAGAIATSVILNTYNGTSGSWELYVRGPSNYNMGLYVEGGPAMEPAGTPAVTDSLVSWAITRAGDTSRLFINGEIVAFQTNASYDWSMDTPGTMCIGKELASNTKYFKGRYRHRITNGVARYVANYTPPTFPLPANAP